MLLLPAAALALAYGAVWTLRPVSPARSVIKTGSTALLALAGLWAGVPGIALALALGAIGDWFLSRPREVGFLPGLGSFALGHGVYLRVLWPLAGPPGLLASLVLSGVALALISALWSRLGALRGPVAAYAALSVALGLVALGMPAGLLPLGLLAFILSDIVLAVALFLLPPSHPAQPVLSRLLWVLYWGGQAAILLGAIRVFSAIDGGAGIA
ncbi:lysoplasmalogenase [Rhodobacterales bacterium HKCCSP123]|nr:lysoplasmalogenase [Rhodobacterales bacterium HKCCSP123]